MERRTSARDRRVPMEIASAVPDHRRENALFIEEKLVRPLEETDVFVLTARDNQQRCS
jgi:hypothetical protein